MTDYQYKESGMEWLGEIPAHWEVRKVKRLAYLQYGDNLPEGDRTEGGVSVYGSNGIVGSHHKSNTSGNTIIVGRKGSAGALNFSQSNAFVIDTAFYIDEKNSRCNLKWLYYLLQRLNLTNLEQESPVPGLNRGQVHYKKVPAPPLSEQKAIADYLDTACQKIGRVIAKKEKQIEKIEKLYKSEIYEKCTKGINNTDFDISEIEYVNSYPKHWKIKKLKRSTRKIDTGHTPDTSNSKYFKNGDIEWFSPESITDDIEIETPKKLINRKALEDNQIKLYPANSVFFVGVGATAGKVGIIRKPSSCNQQINIIQTKEYLLKPEFLVYQLKILEKEIIKFAQYTTLPILNQSRTGLIDIVVPPINEQEKIVEYLNALAKQTNGLKEKLYSQIEKLKDYKKSLIHECVTGKKQVFEGAIDGAKEKAFAAN